MQYKKQEPEGLAKHKIKAEGCFNTGDTKSKHNFS